MEARHRDSAERMRALLEGGAHEPYRFRAALREIPAIERDAWLDLALGLGELPEDGPELPKGCVPYLPCPVDDLLHVVECAPVQSSDVFVDIGSGVGRAATFVHLLTGAPAIGLEVQPRLVEAARALATRLQVTQVTSVAGDAAELGGAATAGTRFLLYCPFSGERLTKVLGGLESLARTRPIRVCCVDLPLPPCEWLVLESVPRAGLEIHRSI